MNNEPPTTIGELTFGVASREGQRPNQEDRWEARAFETADGQTAVLALVADGIGGGKAGEMASYLAKETVREYILAQRPITSAIPVTLVKALEEANQRIYERAEQDPGLVGMGTTCTAVVIVGYRLYLAHVGDTRAYLVRGNKITQLSVDHNFAEELRRLGRPEEEIRQHPNRHVIKRYLGIDPQMKVDTHYRSPDNGGIVDSVERPLYLQDGDTLLLCSDGLTDVLEDQQLLSVLRRWRASQAAPALVERALKAPPPTGSKEKDNVTALVFNLPGWRKAGPTFSQVSLMVGALAIIIVAVAIATFTLAQERMDKITPTPTTAQGIAQAVETPTAPPTVAKRATATPRLTSRTQTAIAVAAPSVTSSPTEQPTSTPVEFTPTSTPTATVTKTPTPLIGKGGELLLLEPACGGQWIEGDTAILRWKYGRSLRTNEYFEIRIWPKDSSPEKPTHTDKVDKWKSLEDGSIEAQYEWKIAGYNPVYPVQYEWKVFVRLRTLSKPVAESQVCWFKAVRKGGGGSPQQTEVPTPKPVK